MNFIVKNNEITCTRTNSISFLEPFGYGGEYSNEAWEILADYEELEEIEKEANDPEFPYGACSWFDVMQDENGELYAVFGEDNKMTDSLCYYVEVIEGEQLKSNILESMKTLIRDGEPLCSGADGDFTAFAEENNYPLYLVKEVYRENEKELNELFNEINL